MKFEVGEEIGRGGFCMVHHVTVHDDDGAKVGEPMAIKRLRDDLRGSPEGLKEIRERFEREARLLDDTLDHDNIVPVLYRNLGGKNPFFIMPLADENVWSRAVEKDAGNEAWVCGVFRQVLDAMAYTHGKGVIHRDLKPENILLYGDHVRVSDLGFGKNLTGETTRLTRSAYWLGTDAYVAPECRPGMEGMGPPADVFSLGKLLMALLTGQHPEEGVPDVTDLPERFRYFVFRCCEKKPENRFAEAKTALEAFERVDGRPVFRELESELEELVESWFVAPEEEDLEVVRQIDQLLREHPNEEALFTRQVPGLPVDLISQYVEELPDAFAKMLAIYDEHVSGGLPYPYCDEVADLYCRVFMRTERLDIRRLVVARLLTMGSTHHRYHVRDRLLATLSMLDEEDDSSTVAMVADEVRDNPRSAFAAEIAPKYELVPAVRTAFKTALGKNS
ncbi:MAG TPA: serine/threonine-protein kinase [Solirubrobacterales bacterium]|nr:serine/threonine-protein kinase [Solirubrobacterales bacterium]